MLTLITWLWLYHQFLCWKVTFPPPLLSSWEEVTMDSPCFTRESQALPREKQNIYVSCLQFFRTETAYSLLFIYLIIHFY